MGVDSGEFTAITDKRTFQRKWWNTRNIDAEQRSPRKQVSCLPRLLGDSSSYLPAQLSPRRSWWSKRRNHCLAWCQKMTEGCFIIPRTIQICNKCQITPSLKQCVPLEAFTLRIICQLMWCPPQITISLSSHLENLFQIGHLFGLRAGSRTAVVKLFHSLTIIFPSQKWVSKLLFSAWLRTQNKHLDCKELNVSSQKCHSCSHLILYFTLSNGWPLRLTPRKSPKVHWTEVLVTQSGPTLTPRAAARQAPLSTGFSRQGCWSRQPGPPPGDLPNLGFEPESPTPQADSALSEPPGKPKAHWKPPQTPRLSFLYKHGWTVGPTSGLLPSDVTGGWDHQSGETLVGPPPSSWWCSIAFS